MANTANGNTFYIDTQYSGASDDLARPALVQAIFVTATAANAQVVLSDVTAATVKKVDLRVAAAGTSQLFSLLNCEIAFPNGIRVSTLVNCIATVVFTKSGS